MSHLKTFAKGVAFGGIVGVLMGIFSAPKKATLRVASRRLGKTKKPKLKRAAKKVIGNVKKTAKKANKNKKGKKK